MLWAMLSCMPGEATVGPLVTMATTMVAVSKTTRA